MATVTFARTMADYFSDPAGFAIANLSAFNTHGGFLGSVGIDARSLLAAATGGDQGPGAAAQASTERVAGKRGKHREGDANFVWVGLRRILGYYGTFSSEAVAGIAEIGVRVCLRRCRCPTLAVTSQWSLEQSALETGRAEGRSGFGDDSPTPWIERDRNTANNLQSPAGGNVPLTLKLELISIQDSKQYGVSEPSRSGINQPHTISGTETADKDGGNVSLATRGNSSNSDGPRESEDMNTSGSKSFGSKRHMVGGSAFDRDTDSSDTENHENQCEVSWCGGSVGSTRAPLAGLPLPRWEDQVFYLPLSAAAYRDGPTAAVDAESTEDKSEPSDLRSIADNSGWGQEREMEGRRVGGKKKKGERGPPPLLSVTLNRISVGRRGRSSCNGACRDGGYFSDPVVAGKMSPWLAYLSGEIEPVAVGRVLLGLGTCSACWVPSR